MGAKLRNHYDTVLVSKPKNLSMIYLTLSQEARKRLRDSSASQQYVTQEYTTDYSY